MCRNPQKAKLFEARRTAHGVCLLLFELRKRGQEPIVRSTLRAIWLLVPDPFFEPSPSYKNAEDIIESTRRKSSGE